jgi:hypothetical protein
LIIVEQKPFDEILGMLDDHQAEEVLIVGCNGCAGIYQVGGEKQVEVMGMLLEMAHKLKGNNMKTRTATVLRQCDRQIVATALRPIIEGDEIILSMGCGAGVQTIAETVEDRFVIPALNTMFIGMQERELGELHEKCKACGDCILGETAGICPITMCAKSLLNGPCGGYAEGMCEVENYTHECAWCKIYEKLKALNRLDLFTKPRLPRDWRISLSPRNL